MAIVNHFYNGTTRRYIALFGSLFNKMSITRDDNNGTQVQRMVVPISYGPFQKFLAKITQDPGLNRPQAVSLPRMSFEIASMSYDGARKTGSRNMISTSDSSAVFSPAPYNIEFNLYIMTKYAEDGTKILEQIIPFFKPEYTYSAYILDDVPAMDIPLVLNSISTEDLYEADFETRRTLMWTLSFTMKGWYFGPVREKKRIKFVDIRNYTQMEEGGGSRIMIQPGLTANGTPTDDIQSTIPYQDIEIDDDWGVITIIEDLENGDEQ
jgi:hypothetical protein